MRSRWLPVFLAISLSGCSLQLKPPVGIDGIACVGRVAEPPFATTEIKDDALLGEARASSGKGGVCAARVFVVPQNVRVYRLWDSSRATSTYGRWWSLTRPEGTKEAYRAANAICPEWSALDRLVSCTIKPGRAIAIGPTQSAECDGLTYPKSGTNQVYVRNDTNSGQLLVEDCHDEGPWPPVAQ